MKRQINSLDHVHDLLVLVEPQVVVGDRHPLEGHLEWKLLSCSHCQELGQLADLAPDWLFMLVQPIRSQFAC